MMTAIGGNDNELLYNYLFNKGVDVAHVNSEGANAMHMLASSGVHNPNIYEYLVSNGLDWNSTDNQGNNLFNYVARGSNLDLLRFCVEKGLTYNSINENGENALFYATYSRRRGSVNLEVFQYLESLGLEVDLVNWEGKKHPCITLLDTQMSR